MNDLTPHQKALLFTGLMMTMADHLDHFTIDQLREMCELSKKNREFFMKELNKDDSPNQVMVLARLLAQ